MGEIQPKTCEGRELTKDQLPVTIDGAVHDIDGASFPSFFLEKTTGNRFYT